MCNVNLFFIHKYFNVPIFRQIFPTKESHSQYWLLNLRSSVKKHRCDRLLAPLRVQPSGLCLLWLASRITELCLNRKRKTLAAVLPSGISGDKLKCWNFEINEEVRIICCECYRCSSHSLRDLKGEEVPIFFYTGWKKTTLRILNQP